MTIKLIDWIQVSNPARRQKIVNVDQELLLSNLTICQDEKNLLSSDTGFLVHTLDVSLKITHLVSRIDHDSLHVVANDEC